MNYQQDFFEKTVKNFPSKLAVQDGKKNITYKELDKFSNKLGNLLHDNGCRSNDRVCILTKKNINQYASVLGILKSGSCWVPLSDTFPEKRIELLLKMLEPKFLIVEEVFYSKISNMIKKQKIKLIIIDKYESKKNTYFSKKDILKKKDIKPKVDDICSSDLAYIIFTSGSTGKPKGVMVTHENTSHFIRNSNVYFKPKRGLKYAHVSELTFDPSIFDMFVCWKNVGTIVPFNKQAYKINPFIYFKENKGVNVVFCVPSLFKKLEDLNKLKSSKLSKIKHLIFTGEKIPNGLPTSLYKSIKNIKIYNLYGATETAILSHWHQVPKSIKPDEDIPVGKPIPNFQVFLVNEKNEISKNGPGFVHVYSPQVSPGYWRNPFATNLQFIQNPKDNSLPQKVYKIGDMLRKDQKGYYYFLGRADNQVKIRGHRIELEEVENSIKQIEGVADVIAIAYNRTAKVSNSDLFIFIRSNSSKIDKSYINKEIKKNLPIFMIPTDIFILKEDFPRTLNGKVDKKELTKKILKYLA